MNGKINCDIFMQLKFISNRKNKILIDIKEYMNLKTIMLSEINQIFKVLTLRNLIYRNKNKQIIGYLGR